MNEYQRDALQELIEYALCSTLEEDEPPPCIKVLEAYLNRAYAYPHMLQSPNGDFIVVAARNREEAVSVAADNGFEFCEPRDGTFLEELYDQYGGVAVLSTGD